MGTLIRYFLPNGSIDKINLCIVGIKVHLYSYLISCLGHFNTLRSILCMEQLAIG